MANCPSFDIVILQLFDNTSFHAGMFEGELIPFKWETSSSAYHMDGDLVLQLQEALEKTFNDYRPVLRVCANIGLSLLPRNVTVGCCQEPEHTSN
jgi:hypothetical protein